MRYALIFTVLFGLACSKSESPSPAATEAQTDLVAEAEPPPAEPSTELGTSALPSAAPPSIQIITAGESPRRALRWAFEKGLKETLEISTEITQTPRIPGDSKPEQQRLAPIRYEVTVETKEVAADGTARVAFEVSKAEVLANSDIPPRSVDQTKESLVGVKGMSGTYTVDSHGVVRDVQRDVSTERPLVGRTRMDSVQQLLYRTTVPVPEQEVGRGAKWSVKQVVVEAGARIEQLSTVELKNIDGSRMDVDLKIERTAATQNVVLPGRAPGTTYRLLGIESEGIGDAKCDLTRLVPQSSSTKSTSSTTMLVPGRDGNPAPIQIDQDIVETMSGK